MKSEKWDAPEEAIQDSTDSSGSSNGWRGMALLHQAGF